MRRSCIVLILSACILQNTGVAAQANSSSGRGSSGAAGGAQRSTNDSQKTQQRPDYVLQPFDLIKVNVHQEDDINQMGDVRLSQDSVITLPMINKVELKGLTVAQAEARITERYGADYLVNPSVNVRVIEYSRRTVQVTGQVGSPGMISFPQEQELTLLGAIGEAKDFTRLANRKTVTIRRISPNGEVKIITVDVEKTVRGGADDPVLQPGDVIEVKERVI
jgi:protein involved in polysaccharide export with SLBB domain